MGGCFGSKKEPAWKRSIREYQENKRAYEEEKRAEIIRREEERLAMKANVKIHGSSTPIDVTEILENKLWLGNVGCAHSLEWLNEHEITAILNISKQESLFTETFEYKEVRIEDCDWEDIDAHFDSCIAFINKQINDNERVLVHCKQGISRSATIVMAFLMFSKQFSSEEALSFVQLLRPKADPNPGFQKQLCDFNPIRIHGAV